MGKKKRGGVIWSQDRATGSPIGQDVHVWDGVSRTSKRTQKKAYIADRKDLLLRGSQLDEDILQRAQDQLKATWSELDDYHREIEEDSLESLVSHLESLKMMKRSSAKQRLVKHITASLDATEWSLLEKLIAYSEQAKE